VRCVGCRAAKPSVHRPPQQGKRVLNLQPERTWRALRTEGIARRVFARFGRTTVAGGAASRLGRASHRTAAVASGFCLWYSARLRADDSCVRGESGGRGGGVRPQPGGKNERDGSMGRSPVAGSQSVAAPPATIVRPIGRQKSMTGVDPGVETQPLQRRGSCEMPQILVSGRQCVCPPDPPTTSRKKANTRRSDLRVFVCCQVLMSGRDGRLISSDRWSRGRRSRRRRLHRRRHRC